MTNNLTCCKASPQDLRHIIELLIEDELGQGREHLGDELDPRFELMKDWELCVTRQSPKKILPLE
jgi:hypothetical protein